MATDPLREDIARPSRNELPQEQLGAGTEPVVNQDRSIAWLPLLVMAALLIGVLFYLFGDRLTSHNPNVRADNPVTKSQPSPN
jgi:hypothetical protein